MRFLIPLKIHLILLIVIAVKKRERGIHEVIEFLGEVLRRYPQFMSDDMSCISDNNEEHEYSCNHVRYSLRIPAKKRLRIGGWLIGITKEIPQDPADSAEEKPAEEAIDFGVWQGADSLFFREIPEADPYFKCDNKKTKGHSYHMITSVLNRCHTITEICKEVKKCQMQGSVQ